VARTRFTVGLIMFGAMLGLRLRWGCQPCPATADRCQAIVRVATPWELYPSVSAGVALLWMPPPALQTGQRVNQMAQDRKVRLTRSRDGRAFVALRNPLYRTSYALLANTAATTAVGVAFWAVAAHFYDQQVVGRSAALVSALLLVSTFAQLNLTTALPRFLPRAGRSAGKFIAYSYGASSCAALIGGLVFVTVLPHISSQWQFVADSLPLKVAFVVAAAVWEVFALQDIALLSLRRPALVPVENFVYGVSKLLMLVGVVSLLPSTGIFLSWVIPLAVTVPAVNWLIFRRYLKKHDPPVVPDVLRVREVVRFASVDYIGSVLGQAYSSLLPLLVLSTLGAAANSSFYIAWSIAAGLGLVASNFGTSLLVEGAAAPDRLRDLTRGVLARCMVITSLGAVLLGLAARPILDLYGSRYAQASSLLSLLAVGTIPSCFVVVAMSLDRIVGRVGRATLTRLVLTVLVLGGSWLLVRKEGIDGVAFAWGGANLVVALARSPTLVSATRKRVSTAPMPIPVSQPVAETQPAALASPPQSSGFRRRPAGRHRAGGRQVNQGQLARPISPSAAGLSTLPTVPDSAGDTARALELLMSLGKEAGFPP
jgi:O-antigen/teichoic acid export membrane protein